MAVKAAAITNDMNNFISVSPGSGRYRECSCRYIHRATRYALRKDHAFRLSDRMSASTSDILRQRRAAKRRNRPDVQASPKLRRRKAESPLRSRAGCGAETEISVAAWGHRAVFRCRPDHHRVNGT